MLTACPSRRPDRSDIAIALALAVLGLAALLAPGALMRVAPPCLFSLLLDHPCWGCGMTRAALAFVRGDFVAAWQFNKASLLVLPMLMLLYARHLHMVLRGLRLAPYARRK
jgi:hypothetical protein